MIELDTVRSNIGRAIFEILAIGTASSGSGMLWGTGGFCLTLGLLVLMTCALDEVVERITRIKRI